jgi:hypothetical protein
LDSSQHRRKHPNLRASKRFHTSTHSHDFYGADLVSNEFFPLRICALGTTRLTCLQHILGSIRRIRIRNPVSLCRGLSHRVFSNPRLEPRRSRYIFHGQLSASISYSNIPTGLPFLSIGLGSCLTVIAEPKIRGIIKRLSSQATGASADSTLPIILVGGTLIPIGQLLFAVSAAPPNSAVVSILAGLPLGIGNMLIFLYVANYLATCYKAHAASALAGHASMRYMGAALLPLLAPVMYGRLGPLVTGLILMAILTVLAAVPIIFMKRGEYFKARSRLAHGSDVCKVKGCKTS